MKTNEQFFFGSRFIIGLFVIALGVLFLLDNMQMIDAHFYFRFWPVVFILIGISHFFQNRSVAGTTWSLVLISVGTIMVLSRLYYTDLNIWSYWPLVLVFIGGAMIAQSMRSRIFAWRTEAGDDDTFVKATAIMGGVKRTIYSKNFQRGEFNAVMGGFDIDMREAAIQDEATLDIFVLMGGIDLKVPEDWKVIIQGIPFMGGITNDTRPPKDPNAKRLIIKGTAVMGGVEIRNTGGPHWEHRSSRDRWREDGK